MSWTIWNHNTRPRLSLANTLYSIGCNMIDRHLNKATRKLYGAIKYYFRKVKIIHLLRLEFCINYTHFTANAIVSEIYRLRISARPTRIRPLTCVSTEGRSPCSSSNAVRPSHQDGLCVPGRGAELQRVGGGKSSKSWPPPLPPSYSLHPPPLPGGGGVTGGIQMKACWGTGDGALQEWEARLEVDLSFYLSTILIHSPRRWYCFSLISLPLSLSLSLCFVPRCILHSNGCFVRLFCSSFDGDKDEILYYISSLDMPRSLIV